MRSTVILCDWAEAVQGKLYLQGGGWTSILGNQPVAFAVAVIIRVDYTETNSPRHAVLALVNEDGQPFPSPEEPVVFEFDFEVGRPPGMKPGQNQIVNFAAKLVGLVFPLGGYEFQLHIGEHRQDVVPFTAIPALP